MTREEAITDIRYNIKPIVGGKSLDMAIKALEQESVLDKIRAEIENHCGLVKENHCKYCSYCNSVMGVREIIEIIDKYKSEEDDVKYMRRYESRK